MAYERINRPKGPLFHYTKRENLKQILNDGKIRKFRDRETWFCTSLENTLRLMELTVMQEGKIYFDADGLPKRYPQFKAEDYVILELRPRYQSGDWVIWNQEFPEGVPEEVLELGREFSLLKVGYRGDLKFYGIPILHEMSDLLKNQEQLPQMNM